MKKETPGKSCDCQQKLCKVSTFFKKKKALSPKDMVVIREGLHLDYYSENVIYLFGFKKW